MGGSGRAEDRTVGYAHSALGHDLRPITKGEPVADLPAPTAHDDVDVDDSFPENRVPRNRLRQSMALRQTQ